DQLDQRPDVELHLGRRLEPEHGEQHAGGPGRVHGGIPEQLVQADVQDPGGVIGPLDVSPDPVQRFGVAGQHQPAPGRAPRSAWPGRPVARLGRPLCCCCCCCWPKVSSGPSSLAELVAGPRASAPVPSSRTAPSLRAASTQVSLLPPPWEEFTTRLPAGSATRVRPPGSTNTDCPSLTANGRRSTCRGASSFPTLVGTVDSDTTGCAIQPRGLARIRRRAAASSRVVAHGPNTMPCPPEPSTGLTTSSARWASTCARSSGCQHRYVATLGSSGFSPR